MAVDYRKEGKIGMITMNNPPMNTLSTAVLEEMNRILDKIRREGMASLSRREKETLKRATMEEQTKM